MSFATLYFGSGSAGSGSQTLPAMRCFPQGGALIMRFQSSMRLLLVATAIFVSQPLIMMADIVDPAALTRQAFQTSKRAHDAHPADPQVTWQFARASFDLGDLATNNSQRADIAQEAIAACKQALSQHPDSAPLHYYLGLNEGQLARTRTFGALRLVDQMEKEFTRSIELDSSFDYAGAERSLGLLYRDAPVFASIGSRSKARVHLQRAVDLAARYPENRLNLIESDLKWGERKDARRELKLLEDSLPAARKEFDRPAWAGSWADWNTRLDKVRKTLDEPARLESPRH
jgi:tetratricopeptide (TPR) repeat protein